jgi:hypothetical protein
MITYIWAKSPSTNTIKIKDVDDYAKDIAGLDFPQEHAMIKVLAYRFSQDLTLRKEAGADDWIGYATEQLPE